MSRAVVSRSDFDRIRASVQQAKVDQRSKFRDEELRKKSQERTAKWPNTLDATRKKKEMWKIEKQAREEAERLLLDKEEDELQRKARELQIKRANALLYEQTDKMKNLRSQMLYCDVIEEQKLQVQEKERKRAMERKMEEHWFKLQEQQLDEYDQREEKELMERVRKVATTAKMQQDQLEVNKQLYIKSLQNEKAEGERLRQKAEEDFRDEQEKELAVRRKARLAVEQLRLENEKLKKIKQQQLIKEQQEEEKRQADADAKEFMQHRRKAQEKKRFDEAQAIKKKLIDKASNNLLAMAENEERILGKQAADVKEKEDRELAMKDERRRKQQAAIERSRKMQLRAKELKREAEQKQTNEIRAHLKLRQGQMEQEEKDEIASIKMKNLKLRNDLETEIDRKQVRKLKSREAQLEEDRQNLGLMGEEDDKFRDYAMNELNAVAGEGFNTVPLQKAVAAKDITTLAVGGIRV